MRDIDLSAIRARLAGKNGPAFWRSLDEVAETPEFQAMLHREFPEGASEFTDPAGRLTWISPASPGSTHDLAAARVVAVHADQRVVGQFDHRQPAALRCDGVEFASGGLLPSP